MKTSLSRKTLAPNRATPRVHRGRRPVTVNGTVYHYRVGRGHIELWKGDKKVVVKHHQILNMTEEEYNETNHIMLCDSCRSYDCPAGYSKYPLNIAVTPAKVRDYIAAREDYLFES